MTASSALRADDSDRRFWSADTFLKFYMTRPDGERWQLVDGLAMMVAPPTFVHQRITGNLVSLLDGVLESQLPKVIYSFLVRVPGVINFCAAPDLIVTVPKSSDEYFTESVVLAAEVLSEFDAHEMIERKLELYQGHPDNLYCLTIDQDSVHVSLIAREANWAGTDLRFLDDVLRLPAFGFEATLAEIYEGTPLGR